MRSRNFLLTVMGAFLFTACTFTSAGATTYKISVKVTGLSGSVTVEDDQSNTLTFTSSKTLTFANAYASGAKYTVSVTTQPSAQACTPTYFSGTITKNITITATCAKGTTRALGTVSNVKSISCQGSIKNGVCQQMTVACPGVPNV